jgi:hypothetical protein
LRAASCRRCNHRQSVRYRGRLSDRGGPVAARLTPARRRRCRCSASGSR